MPQNSWVDFGKKKKRWGTQDLWGPSVGPSMGDVGLDRIQGTSLPNTGAGGSKVYGGGYNQNPSGPMNLGYGNTGGPQKDTGGLWGLVNSIFPGQQPTSGNVPPWASGFGEPTHTPSPGWSNQLFGNETYDNEKDRGISGGGSSGGIADILSPGGGKQRTGDRTPEYINPPYKGPGSSASDWEQFKWWQPQGGSPKGYDPTWSMPIPSGDGSEASEAQIETAHFFNWFNKVLPYLDPKSLFAIIPQLSNAANALPPDQGKQASSYLSGLLDSVSGMGKWGVDAGTYWDRDKLREVQKLTGDYFSGVAGVNDAGQPSDRTEYESYGNRLITLLNTIVGNPMTNAQGVWNTDQPMNRRSRYAYGDAMNSQLTGNSLFDTVMKAILNPVTSAPTLSSSAIGYLPQSSGYLYSPRVQYSQY